MKTTTEPWIVWKRFTARYIYMYKRICLDLLILVWAEQRVWSLKCLFFIFKLFILSPFDKNTRPIIPSHSPYLCKTEMIPKIYRVFVYSIQKTIKLLTTTFSGSEKFYFTKGSLDKFVLQNILGAARDVLKDKLGFGNPW